MDSSKAIQKKLRGIHNKVRLGYFRKNLLQSISHSSPIISHPYIKSTLFKLMYII